MDSKLRRMDSDHPWVSNNVDGMRTIEETMERLIFAGKILGPLLGQQLITPSHVYHIDLEEIDEIERALESIRPGNLLLITPSSIPLFFIILLLKL